MRALFLTLVLGCFGHGLAAAQEDPEALAALEALERAINEAPALHCQAVVTFTGKEQSAKVGVLKVEVGLTKAGGFCYRQSRQAPGEEAFGLKLALVSDGEQIQSWAVRERGRPRAAPAGLEAIVRRRFALLGAMHLAALGELHGTRLRPVELRLKRAQPGEGGRQVDVLTYLLIEAYPDADAWLVREVKVWIEPESHLPLRREVRELGTSNGIEETYSHGEKEPGPGLEDPPAASMTLPE